MREISPFLLRNMEGFSDGRNTKVQRVSQYDKILHSLLENSSNSRHPQDYESLLGPEHTVREMVKEREEEISQVENESRLIQIQERFPNDDLNLFGKEVTKGQKFKAMSSRRRSAPSTVIRTALSSSKLKTALDRSNNNNSPPSSMLALDSANMSCSLNIPESGRRESAGSPLPTDQGPACKRQYIMEGPVQVIVGLQTQSRYLILMNDTLLVAKPKSSTSFRLKHRLRVCELWLGTCIEDVTEIIKSPDSSFVLGWPTTNVVLSFASTQERELWWQSLSKHIESKRKADDGKVVNVKVLNRDPEVSSVPSKTLQVNNTHQSSNLLNMAMQEFGMPEESRNDYQLWVQSGREDALYPLIGHEYPHAIKMSHVRDAQDKQDDTVVPSSEIDQLSSAENELREHQCQFILRRRGKAGSGLSIDTTGIQRRLKKGRKSPFKLSFKRSISQKDGNSLVSPMSPHARLFGLPLCMVCPENTLPKPIMDLLLALYHQAPFVTGVFRKSANARVCRELREALDAGESCNLEDVSVHVAASVFKDFLRSLPDSLMMCSLFDEWIATNDITDKTERINTIKGLLEQFLDINIVLMRHLFCVLHYIAEHMDENNMTGYNLAICVAPSMLWPPLPASTTAQAMATKKVPTVVEFMIQNASELFGKDVLSVFGDPPSHRPEHRRHDSSGDSDSMNDVSPFIKRDDSSLDSIEKELYANDSEQDTVNAGHKWGYGTPMLSPSSLSRDSGITSSDNQLYPDSDNTDTTDSGVDSKEKLNAISGGSTRTSRTQQFSGTDELFWRQRRVSEPSSISKELARKRAAVSAGSTGDNSPNLSDHEYSLSEDTLKLIKDLNQECSSKLLNDLLPEDMRSNLRNSASGSNLQIHEKGLSESTTTGGVAPSGSNSMPTTPTDDEPPSNVPSLRRVSVPSLGSPSPTFPHRLASSRRSASSMSSSSSERMSDAQSSSSSERLYSSKLGKNPHRTEFDMAKTLQAATVNPGHTSPRGGANIGQHGFQPSYKKMFMNSDTRGLPSRPMGAPMRPKNLAVGPSHHRGATPPREFFPKDATTRSSLSHSPHKQQHLPLDKRSQSPVKRNSSPAISTGVYTKQRLSKTQSDSSSSSSSSSRSTPPTYQEAMNRRAILQRQTKSVDNVVDSPSDEQPERPRRRSAESKPRHEDRPSKTNRQVIAGGIVFLPTDSDSSDEGDQSFRSSSSYTNGPTKSRGVRRTSSDSVATNRKGLAVPSVQRSSSDTAKQGSEVRSKHQQRSQESGRRQSQPSPRRHTRHQNGDVARRSSPGNLDRRPTDSPNSSPARTTLHFPFPDPRAEPPESPLISPRSKTTMKEYFVHSDPKNGLKKSREAEQAVTQARRDWQRQKASSGKDPVVLVADLENIDYADESYV